MCLETFIPFVDLGLHQFPPMRIMVCSLTYRRSFTICGRTMENDTGESQSSHEKKEELHRKASDEVRKRKVLPSSIMEAEIQRWWRHIGCVTLFSYKQQIQWGFWIARFYKWQNDPNDTFCRQGLHPAWQQLQCSQGSSESLLSKLHWVLPTPCRTCLSPAAVTQLELFRIGLSTTISNALRLFIYDTNSH